jgi:hypothetical protein
MTDEEFIGYVEVHSQTPRALFSAEHIKRLLNLCKISSTHIDKTGFYSLRHWEAKPYIEMARTKLKEAPREESEVQD